MAITPSGFKNGMAVKIDGKLWQVVDFQHVKPGKGPAFVRTKFKSVDTGAVVERTLRPEEKLEQAIIDRRDMQFLYNDGTDFVFMDAQTYDQVNVAAETVGESAGYLKESDDATVAFHDDEALYVELPAAVVLEVAATEPGVKGDRVSGAMKAATLETGKVVQVPLFVETGDRLKIDTRTGDYLSRAN